MIRYKTRIHNCPRNAILSPLPPLTSPSLLNTSIGLRLKDVRDPGKVFEEILDSEFPNTVAFYTDGSKKESFNYVGFAAHSPSIGYSEMYRISSHASIFSAEALALRAALREIEYKKIEHSVVFTDSLSVVTALSSPNLQSISSPFLCEIKDMILSLISTGLNLTICWIPAHRGIAGNETADALAKTAISNGRELQVRLPFTDFYASIKQALADASHQYFSRCSLYKGKVYHETFYRGPKKPWFSDTRLPRDFITTITRMRSNHFNLASSLHRKNYIDSPACDCLQDDETLDHVFWSCEKYDEQRSALLSSLAHFRLFPPFSIFPLLASARLKVLRLLFSFLKASKLSI